MTPLAILGLTFALLLLPRLLLPSGRVGDSSESVPIRSEVRGGLRLLWWVNRSFCVAIHRLVVIVPAPLPSSGPAILVCNHTSGIDNLILQAGCDRVLGFLIAREFHEARFIGPIARLIGCIPVRRDGRDLTAAREALRALEAGRVVPIFPEGRINPDSGRSFGPGKPGAAFLALRTEAPVIPAYIRGTPATRSVWRAILTPSRTRVIFGPAIELSDLRQLQTLHEDRDRSVDRARTVEATDRIMQAIRDLRDRSLALEPDAG